MNPESASGVPFSENLNVKEQGWNNNNSAPSAAKRDNISDKVICE